MEVAGTSGVFADPRVEEKSVEGCCGMMSSENPLGVITVPKIKGGFVTRMTINPVSGAISSITIETSEPGISFPEEVRFDQNATINIQRIIIIGGSGRDTQ